MLLPSSLMSIRTHRVTNNLKEYAVKALVNTVDHLGSISFKVSSLIDQRFSEATDADLRISCIHQVFSVQKPSSFFSPFSSWDSVLVRTESDRLLSVFELTMQKTTGFRELRPAKPVSTERAFRSSPW